MAMGGRRSRQVPDLKNHSSVVTFKLAMLLAVAFQFWWTFVVSIFDSGLGVSLFSTLVSSVSFSVAIFLSLHAFLLLSPHIQV